MALDLLQALQERVLIANGAMGTMLAAHGLRLANSALANVEAREVVADIFRQYQQAGATVFQANTFAANAPMLSHAGLADRHDEINRAAMRLLREAVGPEAFVAANFGPTGEMLRPLGLMSPEEAQEIFRRQAEVLLSEGPDFVLLETFEALEELEVAVAGIRQAGLQVPLVITFSFSQPSGRSMMGVSPQQAAETMVRLGAEVIGANCGLPEVTLAAVREMAGCTDLPLAMQANAGLPELVNGEAVFSGSPEASAELARQAVAVGARLIGGCCGTGPEHIRAMAQAVS